MSSLEEEGRRTTQVLVAVVAVACVVVGLAAEGGRAQHRHAPAEVTSPADVPLVCRWRPRPAARSARPAPGRERAPAATAGGAR
ncbi:MAG: hypothetical protein ACM33B_09055 [Pseudomonadota bacterium]